ncbi:uncharacterized protein [Aegilops tauschii subsp. strangulata]|uniref:uncharacterized protein n=1 Tax=Aegilops tauschii subsp. strangulata TaxID=200361 RepID=UPI003CC85301
MVLIRYGVTYLIENPPPPNDDAQYLELDAHVALWIYATLADPLTDRVIGATTTYVILKKIKDFFLNNHIAWFMIVNRQYRNLRQGDLAVAEHARNIKLLTDCLADIDHAVTEINLTTHFLHSLDKCLDTIRVALGNQVPTLSFDTVLSRVFLAEESMAHRAADESASAFALPSCRSSGGSSLGNDGRDQGDRGDRSSDGGIDRNQGAPHKTNP